MVVTSAELVCARSGGSNSANPWRLNAYTCPQWVQRKPAVPRTTGPRQVQHANRKSDPFAHPCYGEPLSCHALRDGDHGGGGNKHDPLRVVQGTRPGGLGWAPKRASASRGSAGDPRTTAGGVTR